MAKKIRIIDGVEYTRSAHGSVWRDPEGYDEHGYDRFRRDRGGFGTTGWRADGVHRDTGTIYGPDGYTRANRDGEGYNRRGYDDDGGMHRNGTTSNDRGFNAKGFHLMTGTRYDTSGYDWNDWSRSGIHRLTGSVYGPDGLTKDGESRADVEERQHALDAAKRAAAERREREASAQQQEESRQQEAKRVADEQREREAAERERTSEPEKPVDRWQEDTYITPAEARAYMLGRLRGASRCRTDVPFTRRKIVARWDSRFRDENREPVIQHLYRLYAATSAEFERMVDDGLMEQVSDDLYVMTDKGFEAQQANYRLWRAASGIIADMHRWH